MAREEQPSIRPGTYVRPDEPGTLYGVEEPEDLPTLPPYLDLFRSDGDEGPGDEAGTG